MQSDAITQTTQNLQHKGLLPQGIQMLATEEESP